MTAAAIGSLGLAGAVGVWGVGIEPRLIQRREWDAAIPNLPESWDGQRIGMFSDIQVGIPLANVDTAHRAARMVIDERPALALLPGDFISDAASDPEGQIERAVAVVRPLPAAGIPTYVVFGNHEYPEELQGIAARRHAANRALRDAFEETGVRVLQNEVVALDPPPGARPGSGEPPLYLAGIDDHSPRLDRARETIGQVPESAPRIVMMHNPRTFEDLPPGSAPLGVAGHTHGGQIRMPLVPQWTPAALLGGPENYRAGWRDGYGRPGNRLYVTRGIGFSSLPMRIGCPPEVTFFTLRRA
jgi:uncharacterized protein